MSFSLRLRLGLRRFGLWLLPAVCAVAPLCSVPDVCAADKVGGRTIEVWPVTLRNYSFVPGTGDSTIHIKADNAAVIDPAVLKVTEDGQFVLPGVEVQAGAAWVHQIKSKTRDIAETPLQTKFKWLLYVNGEIVDSQQKLFKGVPTEKEWHEWNPAGTTFPHSSGAALNNDNLLSIFDLYFEPEGFTEGPSTIDLEISGETWVWRNHWDPADWNTSLPVEWTKFDPFSKNLGGITVVPPYDVWKSPSPDEFVLLHPAQLEVQLWDHNTTSLQYKGNLQHYESPRVRSVGPNGAIGPGGQIAVYGETHLHGGTHPPTIVHVLPDFAPISIDVVHRQWDNVLNQGKEYRRTVGLHPTLLFCIDEGTETSTPGAPADPPLPGVPANGGFPQRAIATPGARILPVPPSTPGPHQTTGTIITDIVSLRLGLPTLHVDATPDENDVWECYGCVASGDSVQLRYAYRDNFGQNYADTITVVAPDTLDLAAPLVIAARQPVLVATTAEVDPDPALTVEVRVCDLASAACGDIRLMPGINVTEANSGFTALTDSEGTVSFTVARGQILNLLASAPGGAYQSLVMPPTPPLEINLIQLEVESGLWKDDRVVLYMTPDFSGGPLHPGSGLITNNDGLLISHVGAVSNLALPAVVGAAWETISGLPLAPALVRQWGISPRPELGYAPALFMLGPTGDLSPDDPVYQALLQTAIDAGGVRLLVSTLEGEDLILEMPVEEDIPTGVEPVPSAVLNLQAAPNPFNPVTTLTFQLARAGSVQLNILAVDGRHVATVLDRSLASGPHRVEWRGRNDRGTEVASGVYLAQLVTPFGEETRKLVLVR